MPNVASYKRLVFVDDYQLNSYTAKALLSELITGVSIVAFVFM